MKKLINLIIFICIFVIIICLYSIINSNQKLGEDKEIIVNLMNMTLSNESSPEYIEKKEEILVKYINAQDGKIRDKLLELEMIYDDLYAWIVVPGTYVDYPIMQNEADDYYLKRTLNGKDNIYGSIYTNSSCNSKDFTDFNTILYGHNREDNVMFASLHMFDNEEFFNENDKILVYTNNNILVYQIYACVKHNNMYLPDRYNFNIYTGKQSFIDMLSDPIESEVNHIRKGMKVTADDKLITLSTCMDVNINRFLVVGVLIEELPYW